MQNHIGIIGGGIAGSTVATRLTAEGYKVTLLESGKSLVNGPPICHLHAGGNLYRDLSDDACLILLKQSIDTLKYYAHAINFRPTVIAVPNRDQGHKINLVPRLVKLRSYYQELIAEDPGNEVLGKAKDYFRVYTKDDLTTLAKLQQPASPQTPDDWMIPFAQAINISDFKGDFYLVQEYGVSLFRLSATVSLKLEKEESCQIITEAEVIKVDANEQGWTLKYRKNNQESTIDVDFLVNAAGFRTGEIDDLLGFKRQRMAELKAAYISQWPTQKGIWPEVIFHGIRGTKDGMASMTPYPNHYMQLHGMTENITLFKDGLSKSTETSAQPQVKPEHLQKVDLGWEREEVIERTQNAINHITALVPSFSSASVGGKPLFGIQQIPGLDASCRTADTSFEDENYARVETIKLSSTLLAADKVVDKLKNGKFTPGKPIELVELNYIEVESEARKIAISRGYPEDLAKRVVCSK